MSALRKKILIVEDEADIRDLMSIHLEREGYDVCAVSDGETGMKKIPASPGESFDLFVLDWMLPGVSGVELARAIRKSPHSAKIPILMVTARVEPADIVLGLEAGADDYVTKPFEIAVFLARVRALLRRASLNEANGKTTTHQIGKLFINEDSYEVRCDGEPVQLTHSEFKLLAALAKNTGKVLTRTSLIDLVQGSDVSVVDRTIDTHVFGLRKKLGVCGDLIETVRGVGYRMKSEG